MKKKLAIVATVFIACTITISVISNNKETSYQDDNLPIVRKQENLLSYYLEDDNGEYEITSGETWPTNGYTLNTTLSKCENGSTLSWDSTNKIVTMTGNVSDKCYVYFDKEEIKPIINSINSAETGEASYLIISVDYTSEEEIVESYISVDDGSFIKNNSNSLFYYNLSSHPGSQIDIKLYIKDSKGRTSDIYSVSNFTVTYTCFPAGTKILTKNGYKNIEDIKVNDFVCSYNDANKTIELKKVTEKFIHEDIELYNIYLNNEIIRVTPFHKFYVLRNNQFEWLAVKDIKLTDKLFDSNKQLIDINKIEYMKENNTVYNIEVEDNHSYFVSEKNILVHNYAI